MKTSRDLRIAIIGTGFAGICAAIKLREAGHTRLTILERSGEVGGTWRDNDYPGAACDVPAILYSFSFAPNPDWSRYYCGHRELYDYLRKVADDYGLRRYIRFHAPVEELRFDDHANTWTVHTPQGAETFDVVISGTGTLSLPAVPKLPGIESFTGKTFHSSQWDHSYDLSGKNVAVVGTGASAIQFVPEIAPTVERLSVFQRTPAWVMPREERAYSRLEKSLFARVPLVQRIQRWKTYWQFEWLARGFLGEQKVIDRFRRRALAYIEEQVPSPELRAAVTPDYDPGCKRRLISNDWYPALNRDNVDLITDGIAEIRAGSIVTRAGREVPADAIIYGTGFAATDFLSPMKVFGRRGTELSAAWKDGAATHLGVAAADFPNLFMVMGPNTALGHNSIVFMIESQVRYIVAALDHLVASGNQAMAVRPEVQEATYERVQERLSKTVWASGCSSWYLKADGRNDTLWPATTVEYWWRTRRFDPSTFNMFGQPSRDNERIEAAS